MPSTRELSISSNATLNFVAGGSWSQRRCRLLGYVFRYRAWSPRSHTRERGRDGSASALDDHRWLSFLGDAYENDEWSGRP
jgi:hypothetical protein